MGRNSKSNKKARGKDLVPVFRLKKTEAHQGKIQYVGNVVKEKEKLLDELEDLELKEDNPFYNKKTGKNTLYLGNVKGYIITAQIYKCNLNGAFIIQNTEYPVYYFMVNYKNQFVSGSLLEYWYTFIMDDDEKDRLDSKGKYSKISTNSNTNIDIDHNKGKPKFIKYNGAVVKGEYKFGLSCSEKVKDNHKTLLKDVLERRLNGDNVKLTDEQLLSDEPMEKVLSERKTIDTKQLDNYAKFFEQTNHEGKSVSARHIKNKLMLIATDPLFLDIIEIGLISREQERRDDAGLDSDDEFQVPNEKDVINMTDVESVREKFEKDLEF